MKRNVPFVFFVSRRLHGCALLLIAILIVAGAAAAQEAGTRERIYVVTHVDLLPDSTAPGTKLVRQYVADSRKDKGAVRLEVYVQISRANHLSLVEVWENQKAFDDHLAAAHSKRFRDQIQPMLGSPFDERLHQILE